MKMIDHTTSSHFFQTSDLALTATLCLFYPVELVDRSNLPRVVFIFKRSKEFDELIDSYWRGELKVEPQKFFNQLKNTKTRIYSGE